MKIKLPIFLLLLLFVAVNGDDSQKRFLDYIINSGKVNPKLCYENPDPQKDYLVTAINVPQFKKKPDGSFGPIDDAILVLWDSINKYTEIPHEFDN